MKKEFVPYEQALELKQLGFDEECFAGYDIYTTELYIGYEIDQRTFNIEYYILTPLYQQVFRWFREKYGLIGNVNDNCILENTYSISISKIFDSRILYVNGRNHNLKDKQGFTTYEDAELECLKKLIEIVKDGKK